MFPALTRWFKNVTPKSSKSRKPFAVRARPVLTTLEAREVPAGMTIDGSVLRFDGYPGMDNSINVIRPPDGGAGVMVSMKTPTGALRRKVVAPVTSIVMVGRDGNDWLYGGRGNDSLAGAGIDKLYRQAGDDTLVYANDSTWNHGYTADVAGEQRGYDLFDGGADADTILTHGAGEVLKLDDGFVGGAPRRRIAGVERTEADGGNDVIDPSTAGELDRLDLAVANRAYVDGGGGNDIVGVNPLSPATRFGGAGDDGTADVAEVRAGQVVVNGFENTVIGVPTDQWQDDDWSCGPNSAARSPSRRRRSTGPRSSRSSPPAERGHPSVG